MNSLYIGIGVAIIIALVTALVGPYFVDWTAYRSVFEREGQKIFGENVTVLGRAQVRLLPAPSISLDDVVIGPLNQPDLKIDRLDLKLELMPLIKGEIRISELRLDRPAVRLGLGADGKPVVPGMYASPDTAHGGPDVGAIGLEFAEIVDGKVMLFDERNGTEATIDGLNGTASAAALAGPLKLDGGAQLNGHPFTFRFATGRRSDDGLWPMRLQANPVEAPFQLNLDGAIDTRPTSPKASGTLTLQRLAITDGKADKLSTAPTPWQFDAAFIADIAAISLDNAQLSVGDAETATTVTAKGRIDLGATPKFDIELAAKQIDLDRLIAQKIDEPADPQIALARTQDLLLALPKLPLAGRLQLGVGGIVIGGGVVQDLALEIRTRADGWAIDAFSARLPGRSRVTASGRLTETPQQVQGGSQKPPAGLVAVQIAGASQGPRFDGDVSLVCDQPATLLQWWKKRLTVALDPFSFSGHLRLGVDSIKIDELKATIGVSKAKGALQWLAATAQAGARLVATISADQLDLDQVKVIGGLVTAGLGSRAPPSGNDAEAVKAELPAVTLDLDTGVLVVSGAPLKGVTAKAAFDGASLTIDRLTIRDALGAAIDVRGRIDKLTTTPDGAIDGSISAARLGGLLRLVETFSSGPGGLTPAWVKQLVAASPALGPLNAKARLTGEAGPEASNVHLTLDGTAAGSRLALEARFDGRLDRFKDGALDASLQLEGPDGGLILRQIGLPALSDTVSTGKLLLSAKGTPASGLAITANATVASTKLVSSGHAILDDRSGLSYDGEGRLTTPDLRLVSTMFSQPLPSGGSAIPLDLKARIAGAGLKAKLSNLSGKVSDVGVIGGADVDLGQWPLKLDGTLQLTQADLTTLLEFGLGADAFEVPVPKGGVWPSDVLTGPIIAALNANIDIKADRLMIDLTRGIDRFSAKLRLRPGQVMLDDMGGRFASGTLAGALGISSAAGGEVNVTGNLQMNGARLADIVWRRDDRAVADGAMELAVTFESTGRTIAALAADLGGNGAVTVTDGMLRYVDPDAFGAIIVAADSGLELKDDKIRSVFLGRLDAGTLPFQRIEAAFAIGSGVLRVSNMTVTSDRAKANGAVALDFGRWTMDADWTLKVDPGKNGVVGAEPQVGVLFRGALDKPRRTIDVAPLSAFLTLRAFEREVQRVEDMQADIMEQQRFQRELKRLKQERQEHEDAQKAAELAAKQKAIEAQKAAEAEKALEAQRVLEAKRAEDARLAEEARKADEARRLEDTRKAIETQKALDAQKAIEAKKAEDARIADDARKAEDAARRAKDTPNRTPDGPAPSSVAAPPATPQPATSTPLRTRPSPTVLPDLPPPTVIGPKPDVVPLAEPAPAEQ